ncbi:MAG: class I SAM-dependent methyltransferase [Spirochaetia bacterium]|nr:class I SAM-dependent methyltransferase [Spirochaetia bacterium]
MKSDPVAENFNDVAEQYDSQRRLFIPCFDDYYETTVSFLAGIINNPSHILDLGAGTGLLSKYLYEKFPEAEFTLTDIADQMLDVARKRFSGLSGFHFLSGDYTKDLPDREFDLITSALSIHHLTDEEKESLYANSFGRLKPGGCFVNLDQFNPSSEAMKEPFNRFWYDFIDNSTITDEEKKMWLKRRELDKENSIDDTKSILEKCGFKTVECIYSYYKFGVIVAVK